MKPSELVSALKRYRRSQHCVAARLHLSDCSGTVARAHSVSVAAALRPIAKQGEVYRLKSDPLDVARGGRGIAVQLEGVRRASTFYGFCTRHDSELFEPLDAGSYPPTEIEAALCLYRSIAHELRKKESWIAMLNFVSEGVAHDSTLEVLKLGMVWSILALFEHLERLEQVLLAEDFSSIEYEAFESTASPSVVGSSVWFPDFDFGGAVLQKIPTIDHVPALLGMFAVPTATGSMMLLAWHRDSSWCNHRFLHSLITSTRPMDFGDALVRLLLVTSENVFFRPDWWDGLPSVDRARFIDVWASITDMRQPVAATHLHALAGSAFTWSAETVRSSRRGLTN